MTIYSCSSIVFFGQGGFVMLEQDNDLMSCSLFYTFNMLYGKWKPYIIWYLDCAENGTRRYGELKRSIPWQISHRAFAMQLRELEEDGIILRHESGDGKSMKVEYSLTDKGKMLVPVILYLRDFGAEFGDMYSGHTLERTHGKWQGDTINYEYVSKDTGKSVSISFKVNREPDTDKT